MSKKLRTSTRKALIGLVGWAVLLLGIVMIPYPGPGWVVVFIGLSILATEFKWASDVHDYAHVKYTAWRKWIARQPIYIVSLFWLMTFATCIVTIWLLNGYGLLNSWLQLQLPWLESPFVR